MVNSMTGFAALKGASDGIRWSWELRSVNARGLDLRLRLPDGLDDLEAVIRKALTAALTRGSVSLNLRLQGGGDGAAPSLNQSQLSQMIAALKLAEAAAEDAGVHLTASSGTELLALKGVLEVSDTSDEGQAELIKELKSQLPPLIADFVAARATEGQALFAILSEQLDRLRALVDEARDAIVGRHQAMTDKLKENLAKVLSNSEGADENRVAQELALLAVKADVSEEIDRLDAHIAAADELLNAKGAVGRKFDFLMQEFNREANTLCSKSGSTDLTRIGLDLKTVIDQMREQVQNVE